MKALKSYWAILLGLFFTLAYLIPIQTRLLFQPDETRYAEISREMLARGDWIVPHQLGLRYFEKPSGGYWINNISQWLFGDTNFAVRFGSVFSTAVSAALIFVLAWLFWRQWRKSFIAVFIYLSMLLVFSVGTYSLLDPMITLWMTAAMVSFYLTLQAKNWQGKVGGYVLLGIACGMGFMTKGFLALAVPVIAVLPIVIQQRRIKELLIYGPVAIIAAALLSLPWALANNAREPDFWNYFFWVEHIQRFAEKDAQHKEPFWYYLPVLCAAVLPWLALLPGALKQGWQQRVAKPELFFLLSWAVMPLIFFSVAKGKLPTYILPCMAPLALLMTAYAEDCVAALRQRVFKVNAGINIAFGAIGVIALLLVGTGLLPKARVFTAPEWPKLLLGLALFIGWIVFGWLSWRQNARRWLWAVACPLLLCLFVGYALPHMVVNSKQPQEFIEENLAELSQSRFVLSNSVGLAGGVAWQLKRSDVMMFNAQGEVKYGLSYPDAKDSFVSDDDFPAWLAQARKQGNVSVMLQLSRSEPAPTHLPPADKSEIENRLVFLFYKQQP